MESARTWRGHLDTRAGGEQGQLGLDTGLVGVRTWGVTLGHQGRSMICTGVDVRAGAGSLLGSVVSGLFPQHPLWRGMGV